MNQREKIVNWILLVASGVVVVSLWTGPRVLPIQRTLDINAQCAPDGIGAEFREAIHGRDFWAAQLQIIEREAAELENLPRTLDETYALFAGVRRRIEGVAKTAGAPDALLTQAQALRAKADEMEKAEAAWMDIYERRAKIQQLAACRPMVEQKATRP